MDVKFDIDNIDKFQETANKAPGILLKNMRQAMLDACRDIQHDARSDAVHKFRSRHGDAGLEGAIDMDVKTGGKNGIEGKVFIDLKRAPYGKWVHDGSKPHIITTHPPGRLHKGYPNKLTKKGVPGLWKGCLRFVSDGKFFFRRTVRHPGTQKDQFVYKAGDMNRQHINDIFNRYSDRAIREAGL